MRKRNQFLLVLAICLTAAVFIVGAAGAAARGASAVQSDMQRQDEPSLATAGGRARQHAAGETVATLQTGAFEYDKTYVDLAYGGNGKPGWVRAGDMDNDGDRDIVAGGGTALFIYQNDGNGGGWQRYGSLDSTGAMGANGAVLFDVDGDGDLDVVSAKFYGDLGWWQNPGGSLSHSPWTFHKLGSSSFYLHDILVADVDQDGAAEEFVATLNSSNYWNADIVLKWFRPGANPTQAWESHTIEGGRNEGSPHGHAGIDVGDIDGDGNVDLAFANGWYEAPDDPTGSWTWRQVTTIYGISNALIADMNGDGDQDLVVAAGHHGQGAFWFENDGTPLSGSWAQHNIAQVAGDVTVRHSYDANESQHLHHPECLAVEDVDADGDPDVVSCDLFFGEDAGEPDWSEEAHNVYVYENTGNGLSWNRHNIAPNAYPSHLLQLVDVNQDGRNDIISEATGYSVISYYERAAAPGGPSTFEFALAPVDDDYPGSGRPGWSAAGDVNGDGLVDVVAGGGGAIQWYEAPGWARHSLDDTVSPGGNGGLVFDVDGDADLDVVAALFNAELVWWENPGTASPTGAWSRHVVDATDPQGFNHDLAYGDIDGDGAGEVVALYVGSGGVVWYDVPANPKSGPWPRTTILGAIDDPYVGLALGDIDRDGDTDVVASNRWYERPANPSTSNWTGRELVPEPVQNVFVYDVNGDQRLDVVAAEGFNYPDGRVLWAEAPADPRSQSWSVHVLSDTLDGPENIWAGDLNGDGRVEIVTGEMGTSTGWNDNDSTLLVFESLDSGGTSWHAHTVAENVGVSARINPVDIDGDGDTDFTADGNAEDHIYLWLNGGVTAPPPANGIALTITPANQTVASGATASFSLAVANSGSEALRAVALSAAQCDTLALVGGDGNGDGVLQTSETWQYACTVADVTGSFTLTASVSGSGSGGAVVSDSATAAVTVASETGRVTDGLQVLYTFAEGSGSTVRDVSGVGAPLDLSIANLAAVSWLPAGGLAINEDTVMSSGGPASKLVDGIRASNELSIEAWVVPANTTQYGPARIVALSQDAYPNGGNFVLGQGPGAGDVSYDARLRTTETDQYGVPSLTSPDGSVTTNLTHVVFTRATTGATRLYLDGNLVASGTTGGNSSNWGDYALGLANEPNPALGTRPWLGELHLVAIYDRALEQDQVRRNFDAGLGTAVNHPPEAVDDDVSVSEGGTIDTAAQGLPGLLENDYDPDGDTLAASLISDVSHGTLNLAADGSFVYTHDGSEVVADSFSYEANDGNGGSDVAVVDITIVPANDSPIAVNDEYAVAAGAAIDTAANGLPGVLENDSEPDGDPLRATLMDSVDHGTLDLNADGSFVYTHDGSDTASDSFTYEADDGQGGVDSAVVNIAISRANSAPTAADDNYTVDVGGTLDTVAQDLPGVLDNDADMDGDALTATLLTNPAHGTLTLSPDGSFTYTHDGSQSSADGFTYEVTDGNGGFDRATVTIQLHGTRVTEGLLVLYSFEESAGETLHDVSGVGTPLDLTIQDPANTEWISGGGLAIKEETVVTSIGPARKIVEGAMATQELTVEAWVEPANTTQYGPARIVALSQDAYPSGGNFVLGQGPDAGDASYDARLRTTETDQYGIPSLTSPDGSLTTNLAHVVFTRAASGATRLYIDGALVATGTSGGNFSAWGDYALGLANEPDPALGNRPWLGELYLVAVYERALDEAEVLRNFDAGLD